MFLLIQPRGLPAALCAKWWPALRGRYFRIADGSLARTHGVSACGLPVVQALTNVNLAARGGRSRR